MQKVSIGIDDTDSKQGMCTTYVGAVVLDRLRTLGFRLESWPRLVRLNPNWHLKTRGNCAVCIDVKCKGSSLPVLRKTVLRTVEELAELECESTNPGVVIFPSSTIPAELERFSETVIQDVVKIEDAERLAQRIGAEYYKFKLGRGIVGALAAIGETFQQDSTYEILAYRRAEYRGKKRAVDSESVVKMDKATFPRTFDNIDPTTGEIRITPHTPCPVLFGIRSQDPETALEAFRMVKVNEPIERWIIYRTNQGTDAHLRYSSFRNIKPLTSAILTGNVSRKPRILPGGHVVFSLNDGDGEIDCAAYEPTRRFRDAVKCLEVGDLVRVYGGVKKKEGLPLTLNLEKIEVLELKKILLKMNPVCAFCGKRAKSEGKGKGYQCRICGRRFPSGSEVYVEKERDLTPGFYEVPPRARRHLA
ncbi:MAG: tRNA(Ile)(2)-agmatinylcytidine synthase, partial [Candidatus Bathyarchaeia archaeon]